MVALAPRLARLLKMWARRKTDNLSSLWRWSFGLWHLVDPRTAWLMALGHAAVVVIETVMRATAEATRALHLAPIVIRGATLFLFCVGEGLLVRRANQTESQPDLVAAAFVAAALAILYLSTALSAAATASLWAATTSLVISFLFISLIAKLSVRFGWREYMLLGGDPLRRHRFHLLQMFHSLFVLDALATVAMALLLVQVRVNSSLLLDGDVVPTDRSDQVRAPP